MFRPWWDSAARHLPQRCWPARTAPSLRSGSAEPPACSERRRGRFSAALFLLLCCAAPPNAAALEGRERERRIALHGGTLGGVKRHLVGALPPGHACAARGLAAVAGVNSGRRLRLASELFRSDKMKELQNQAGAIIFAFHCGTLQRTYPAALAARGDHPRPGASVLRLPLLSLPSSAGCSCRATAFSCLPATPALLTRRRRERWRRRERAGIAGAGAAAGAAASSGGASRGRSLEDEQTVLFSLFAGRRLA